MGEFGALSCPLCGSENTGYKASMEEGGGSAGTCFSCGVTGPWRVNKDIDKEIDQAVEVWNRRSLGKRRIVLKYTVVFKFRLGSKVKTELGDEGIVTMIALALGATEPSCFVKRSLASEWWLESQLTAVETKDE